MRVKVASILIIFILFTQFAGAYLWLQQKKLVVKSQVKTQLTKETEGERKVLLKFTLHESETKLRWEHAREFEYNAQMYDVIQTKTFGDSVYYWCWWDKEETELNRKLKKLVTQEHPKENKDKNHERFITIVLTPFCQETNEIKTLSTENSKKLNSNYFNFYASFILTPVKPPPRSC